jgi:hypothetical protein
LQWPMCFGHSTAQIASAELERPSQHG